MTEYHNKFLDPFDYSNQKSKNDKIQNAIEDVTTKKREREELDKRELDNKNQEQDIELRKGLASWGKWIVGIYLSAVFLIILCQMLYLKKPFGDVAMIFLFTTTTTNVLGISYLVVKNVLTKQVKNF